MSSYRSQSVKKLKPLPEQIHDDGLEEQWVHSVGWTLREVTIIGKTAYASELQKFVEKTPVYYGRTVKLLLQEKRPVWLISREN
jgi:hypothetical protein